MRISCQTEHTTGLDLADSLCSFCYQVLNFRGPDRARRGFESVNLGIIYSRSLSWTIPWKASGVVFTFLSIFWPGVATHYKTPRPRTQVKYSFPLSLSLPSPPTLPLLESNDAIFMLPFHVTTGQMIKKKKWRDHSLT
jgi:hypothetical protein